MYCNICDKTYINTKTYTAHLKTSYKHKESNKYCCTFCKKEYANSSGLRYHLNVCKIKIEEEKQSNYYNELETCRKEYNKLYDMFVTLQNQYETIKTEVSNKEKEIIDLKLAVERKNIALETTKEVMKEMKPTTNNTYNNKTYIQNIANGLVPIRDDEIRETVDKLSIHHFKQGPKGVVKFVTLDYLAPRVICTDASRHTTVWKDENREIIHDNGSRKLSEKVSSIIGEKDYKPMLDAFDASIDQTCPDDLISINTAYDSVKQFQRNDSHALEELARGISKGAKTVKQLKESKYIFLNLQRGLKKYIDKYISTTQLDSIESIFKICIQHFQTNQEDFEILEMLEKVKQGEYMWFSSKESSASYILDDSGALIIDKHHEMLVTEICKFIYSIKQHLSMNINVNHILMYPLEQCELYQECL
jgi:hypothetical protein